MNPPSLLADENLRYEITLAVRRYDKTIDFQTVQEVGLTGTDDIQLLSFAVENEYLLVSHDVNTLRGFAEDRLREGKSIAGLFLVPISRSTSSVAESLILVALASRSEEWRDMIVYLPF